jgi:hypothetical protein
MNILSLIKPNIKESFVDGVVVGIEKGMVEISTNKIYDVGIGCDLKQRRINAQVNYALESAIRAAREPTLTAETVRHSTGHFLQIRFGRFIIYPKQVKYLDHEDEPEYHKKLIINNPKQYELFNCDDPDNPVFVQLLFGRKNNGLIFAFLNIPDSCGGIYEREELKIRQVETLASDEKVRTPRKMKIRSEKVSGSNV